MTGEPATIERTVQLPRRHANRLRAIAQQRHLSEDQVVTKALDLLFTLADVFEPDTVREDWPTLSEESLARVWENKQDGAYDNWRELYGVPAR